jgi:hypothetical protein
MSLEQEGSGGSSHASKKARKKLKSSRKYLDEVCDKFKQLGWRKSYIDNYFKNMTDFHVEDWTLEHNFLNYAESWYDSIGEDEESFKETLWKTGLTKSKIGKIWKIIQPLYETCYNQEQLYDKILEYLLEQSKVIGKKNQIHYLHSHTTDEWIENEQLGYMMNISKVPTNLDQYTIADVEEKIKTHPKYQDDKKFVYFYHATSWYYGKNIITRGVDHNKGRRCLDFGVLPGFYMTHQMDTVISWAMKNKDYWRNEVVLLIFKLSWNELQKMDYIEFLSPTNEWKSFVKRSRQCEESYTELDDCDFVYGAICKNPKDVVYRNVAPVTKKNLFQLVSKSRKADVFLKSSYMGSLWFAKEHERQ